MTLAPALPLTLQYAVIALAVAVSLWVVFRSQFPNAARRLRIALAVPFVRAGRPAWSRRVGAWIAPAPKAGATCDGCDGCER